MRCYFCMHDKENAITCPYCHKTGIPKTESHQLLPGTVLNNRYVLGNVLGEGGFGITYIGYDEFFDSLVAVKEYFPYGYSRRNNSYQSSITVAGDSEQYKNGKKRFLQEAKQLVKFRNQSGIVEVKDYVEANNTAYIVMEYLEGINLKEYLKKYGLMKPEQVFTMLIPVMESLEKIHHAGLIHRDISPDNIMFMNDGDLKLMDFGAARDFVGDEKSMSVILKHGYAPEEQYRRKGEQGPWTDVYAICATIYCCITSEAPPDAVDRLLNDELRKPSEINIDISPQLEKALLYGLAVQKKDRCPDIGTLLYLIREALGAKNAEISDAKKHTAVTATEIADKTTRTVLPATRKPDVTLPADEPVEIAASIHTNNKQLKIKKKSYSSIIITVLICCVIAVICLIVFLIKINDQGSSDTTTKEAIPTDNISSIEPWTEKEYDANGNITQEVEYSADGTVLSKIVNEYDTNGNIIKIAKYGYSGKLSSEYEYDASGNLIESNQYDSSGKITEKQIYEYDKNGRMVSSSKYDNDMDIRIDYKYDKKGNVVKDIWYRSGKLESWSIYEYDSNGNEIRMTQYDKDGNIIGSR